MTPLTLTVPAPCQWINLNQRLHWAKRAKLTKSWRLAARVRAQQAGLPKGLPRVRVTATIHKGNNRAYDAHNLVPTVKAAIDGLVDYGLIPEDTNQHLVGPDMREGAGGPPRLELTIEQETT
jgi:crossover junction endodeoxyribonuclease RusA